MLDITKLLGKAQESFDKRNYDYAIDLTRQIIDLDQSNARARQILRTSTLKSAEMKGQLPGKITAALKGFIPSVMIIMYKFLVQNPVKLLSASETYLARNPTGLWGRQTIGLTLKNLNYFDSAINEFEGILTLNPRHLFSAKILGELYRLKKDMKKSQYYYQLALSINPTDPDAPRALKDLSALTSLSEGWATAKSTHDVIRDKTGATALEQDSQLTRTENIDEEIQQLKEQANQIMDNQEKVKSLKKIAELYLQKKDYDGAEESYRQAARLAPSDASLEMKIGDIKLLSLDHRINEIQKQLAHQPGDLKLQPELQALQQTKKQFQVEEYQRRVKAHPTDLAVHFQSGVALYTTGQIEEAIAEFQKTVSDPKRKVDSFNYLGCCFLHKKHFDLAITQFNKALESGVLTSVQVKNIRYNLARAYEQAGQRAQALTEYKKIIEVDINYKDAAKKVEQLK